ncbi:MAG: hypothetical protein HQ561_17290 [Desulfobacteraceae bacterium]|nr:hypothetical protein [Desulfobacteraceae bacterium]
MSPNKEGCTESHDNSPQDKDNFKRSKVYGCPGRHRAFPQLISIHREKRHYQTGSKTSL